MEKQAYHIQILLADELDQCKGKGNKMIEEYNSRSILRLIPRSTTTNEY